MKKYYTSHFITKVFNSLGIIACVNLSACGKEKNDNGNNDDKNTIVSSHDLKNDDHLNSIVNQGNNGTKDRDKHRQQKDFPPKQPIVETPQKNVEVNNDQQLIPDIEVSDDQQSKPEQPNEDHPKVQQADQSVAPEKQPEVKKIILNFSDRKIRFKKETNNTGTFNETEERDFASVGDFVRIATILKDVQNEKLTTNRVLTFSFKGNSITFTGCTTFKIEEEDLFKFLTAFQIFSVKNIIQTRIFTFIDKTGALHLGAQGHEAVFRKNVCTKAFFEGLQNFKPIFEIKSLKVTRIDDKTCKIVRDSKITFDTDVWGKNGEILPPFNMFLEKK